jgi:hypothetical protein
VGDHGQHGFLPEGRDGAGDESTGCDVAGDGEEDHVVAGRVPLDKSEGSVKGKPILAVF